MKTFIAFLFGITLSVTSGLFLISDSKEEVQTQIGVGATSRTFVSSQLAPNPTANYILSTNGATSSWIVSPAAGAQTPWAQDIDAAGYDLTDLGLLGFSTTSALTAALGQLTWNADEGTLDLGLNGGSVINQIGQETVAYVKADEAITNGDVVYASSAVGASGRIGVSKFTADNSTSSKFVIGVATEDIANGDVGYITVFGKVRGITTDGSDVGETWTDGTVLYASSTGAGALTNVEPTAPNQKIPIAFVIRAHATNGTLMVRQPDTYNISELHDVFVSSAANRNALFWDSTDLRWENRALVEADISDFSVNVGDMASEDFGDWTCNGVTCSLNANTVTTDEIDLSIAPTWTGAHIFSATSTFSSAILAGTKNLVDYADFYNGTFLESFDATTTSDGATITLHVDASDQGVLTMRFSDGDTILSTPTTTTLTAGTDASPQENFAYIPLSTKTLTVSTSNWPSEEHIKVAYLLVPSTTFVQTNGVYVNQNWNDHAESNDNQGHLSHVGEKIRRLPATYFSGIDANGTDSYLTPTASNVEFKSTSGIIYQMHQHTFPAVDTSAGDLILVKNWSGDAYHDITNLFDITTDSTGSTISNNKYFNLVIWGVGNKSGTYEPIMINLPSGSYNSQVSAENDTSGFDDLTIPDEFKNESSTGFLIARLTIKMGTTWDVVSSVDLRGLTPVSAAGGTAAGAQVNFADNQFTVFNVTDNTKIGAFDLSGVTTATTRTLTWPDSSGTIALTSDPVGDNTVSSSSLNISNWANNYTMVASTTATGGFDWLSPTAYVAVIESAIEAALDTLNNLVDIIVSGSLQIPNGTAPTTDSTGEIALDTTDNQLIVDDGTTDMVYRGEDVIFKTTIASTSVEFVSGGVIPLPPEKDGFTLTKFRCYVDNGTSVVVNLSDGTNDTETITCATTVTSDNDVATNDTFTADEKAEIQIGTITGTPDYLTFTAYGHWTRE